MYGFLYYASFHAHEHIRCAHIKRISHAKKSVFSLFVKEESWGSFFSSSGTPFHSLGPRKHEQDKDTYIFFFQCRPLFVKQKAMARFAFETLIHFTKILKEIIIPLAKSKTLPFRDTNSCHVHVRMLAGKMEPFLGFTFLLTDTKSVKTFGVATAL